MNKVYQKHHASKLPHDIFNFIFDQSIDSEQLEDFSDVVEAESEEEEDGVETVGTVTKDKRKSRKRIGKFLDFGVNQKFITCSNYDHRVVEIALV